MKPQSRYRRRPSRYRTTGSRAHIGSARYRLRRFRTGSVLAVALTALLLVFVGDAADGQDPQDTLTADSLMADTVAIIPVNGIAAQDTAAADTIALADNVAGEASRSVREARGTIREIAIYLTGLLPKIAIALVILGVITLITRLLRPALRRAFGTWEKADAAAAGFSILLWFLALAVALSVVAGSPRALLGSLGLFGLAMSWALQAPIESFTAWMLNSFKGYYRVGDRIGVGDVFGDVYRIDFLNTTVWEAGGPEKPVQGSQPTGAIITFPNSELLRANIINYSRDFPYVWDEVVFGVANESDVEYAMRVAADVARRVVGDAMKQPIRTYRGMLEAVGLGHDIADEPQVYLSAADQWMNIVIRYLVPVRERRRTASALTLELSKAAAAPEHAGRILTAYPVMRQVRMDEPG